MDLVLDDDQVAMRDELRRSLRDRGDTDALFSAVEQPGAVDRKLWSLLADTGVFALCLPVDVGGVGLGLADAAVVFEEVGRAAVPGPVIWSFLAAGLVEGAADGTAVVGGVEDAAPVVVAHLDALDVLVAVGAQGVRRVERSRLDVRVLDRPLDPLTPVAVVDADQLVGEVLAGPQVAARWQRDGALLAAAMQVGLAEAAVRLATAYALDRRQFGRPIGTFQAVKHLLADALVRVEVARAALHAAAVEIDEDADRSTVERAVASARVLASRAGREATTASIQVHGGMGYTWELPAHLLLKRSLVLDTMFGSVERSVDVLVGVS